MIRIAVLNIKGGSGKSTLATNLSAWIAQCGHRVALVDYDPQESSMGWLGRRAANLPVISGVSAKGSDIRLTRVYRLLEGLDPAFAILDTPAAIPAQNLIYFCRDAHKVLIPVLPSRIDIDVCARMIRDLHVHGGIKKGDHRLGIIASRVRRDTVAYKSLRRFLDVLEIPVVADVRDSQNYVRCAESGMGVTELQPYQRSADMAAWEDILRWVVSTPDAASTTSTTSTTSMTAKTSATSAASGHQSSAQLTNNRTASRIDQTARIARLVSLLPDQDL